MSVDCLRASKLVTLG